MLSKVLFISYVSNEIYYDVITCAMGNMLMFLRAYMGNLQILISMSL